MNEAEIEEMNLYAKEYQGWTAIPETKRKAWNRFPPRAFKRTWS